METTEQVIVGVELVKKEKKIRWHSLGRKSGGNIGRLTSQGYALRLVDDIN